MSVEEKYRLSTYKEISVLAEASSKKICVVMEEATDKLYVKKVLPGMELFDFYIRLCFFET